MDALQRLVKDRLAELGDSMRTAADRSHGLVSHSTLSRIVSGRASGRLTAETIAGVALALQIPERDVLAAAEEATRPARWVELSAEFSRLDEQQQTQVMSLMERLLEEREALEKKKIKRARPLG